MWSVYDLIDCVVIVKDSVPSACGIHSRHSSTRLFALALVNFTGRAELCWELKQLPYWWMPTYDWRENLYRSCSLRPCGFSSLLATYPRYVYMIYMIYIYDIYIYISSFLQPVFLFFFFFCIIDIYKNNRMESKTEYRGKAYKSISKKNYINKT